MRILFLSGRDVQYSRNRIILKILSKNHEVDVCTTRFKNYVLRIITTYLVFLYKNLFTKKDLIFVGFLGQPFMPFIRFLTTKKIVLDAYLSMYNTLIEDRESVKNPILKKIIWLYELIACKLADLIILDTNQHIKYFKKEYKLKNKRFERLLIGADDTIFNSPPRKIKRGALKIVFHGDFVPLQGVEYIIRTANLLKSKDIHFYLIGDGKTFEKNKQLSKDLNLDNITFTGRVKFNQIPKYLKKADIGLGIFGSSKKTKMVIPNKVYELTALSVPTITSETPAIKELFTNKKDILLCRHADPKSLKQAILKLKNNPKLRKKLAKNAYTTFQKNFSYKALAQRLTEILE